MASDSFTYANNASLAAASGGTWVKLNVPDVQIVSNAVGLSTTDNDDVLTYYNSAAPSSNHWVEATISTFSGVLPYANIGVAARVSLASGGSGYFAVRTTDPAFSIDLYYFKNGVFATRIGSTTTPNQAAAAGVLRLDVNGTTITVSWNGSAIITVTDSNVTTGTYTGIASYKQGTSGSAPTLDSWQNSVVAATNLAVNNADHAHSADSPTFVQTYQLAVDSASHLHGADGVTFITGTVLAPANADHAHAATSPTLTTPTFITVDNTNHDHGATSPTFVINYSLLVDPASHGHTAAQPSLGLPARYAATVSGRKLLDQYGVPITVRGQSMWMWPQTSSVAQFTSALDTLVGYGGYNAAVMAPFGMNPVAYGGSWNQWAAANGDGYFTGAPMTSTLGPAWDSVFIPMMRACYDRGFFPVVSMYTGYGNTQGWGAQLITITLAEARTLGNRIATKLAGLPFMWHYGADYDFNWGVAPSTHVDALFHGLRDGEVAAGNPARLILCEPMQERTGYSQFNSQTQPGVGTTGYGWMIPSVNSYYHYGSNTAEAAEASWAESSMPTGNCEPYYRNGGWGGPSPTSQQLREEVYASLLEGAVWVNWGDRDIFAGYGGANTANGSDGNPAPDLASNDVKWAGWAFAFAATYCETATYAPSALVTGGAGTGADHAGAGSSSTAGVAYFPSSRAGITINTLLLSGGNVRLRWFDPTSGAYTTISISEARSASRSLTHPGANSAGDTDWVVIVELVIYSLTPDSASHLHSATSPTLTQVVSLAVDNASHGHTAGVVSLALSPSLVVDGAVHGHFSVDPTFPAATLVRNVHLGVVTPIAGYLGGVTVTRAYMGNTQVWGAP